MGGIQGSLVAIWIWGIMITWRAAANCLSPQQEICLFPASPSIHGQLWNTHSHTQMQVHTPLRADACTHSERKRNVRKTQRENAEKKHSKINIHLEIITAIRSCINKWSNILIHLVHCFMSTNKDNEGPSLWSVLPLQRSQTANESNMKLKSKRLHLQPNQSALSPNNHMPIGVLCNRPRICKKWAEFGLVLFKASYWWRLASTWIQYFEKWSKKKICWEKKSLAEKQLMYIYIKKELWTKNGC